MWNRLKNQSVNILRLFFIGNLGLFLIVGIFLLYPVGSSWMNNRTIIQRQQLIYENYTRLYDLYERLIDEPNHPRMLPYDELAIAMANVQALAYFYDLYVVRFDAARPVILNDAAEGNIFVEMKIIAIFSGERCVEFINDLANSDTFIRVLGIDFDEEGDDNLRVEFSLFGRRE